MSAFSYQYAVVCRIPNSFKEKSCHKNGNGDSKDEEINVECARHQHEEYVEKLRLLGIDVLELPQDERHPDCAFVDDCAVIINGTALICKPEASTRLGEVAIVRQTLRKELGLKIVEIDNESATLEGGDVLWTGKEIFVGLSRYTNRFGAQAVAKAFPEYHTSCIDMKECGCDDSLHLKDMISVAGVNILTIGNSQAAEKLKIMLERESQYGGYHVITVNEDRAASVIYANGNLMHLSHNMIPNSCPIFENKIDQVKSIDISEIAKAKRGLSNLGLLVSKIKHPKNFVTTVQDCELQKHVNLDYLGESPGGTLKKTTLNRKTKK